MFGLGSTIFFPFVTFVHLKSKLKLK